ncbi:hypothetical protein WN944_018994 [Citrus x changshan-huyou]
MAYPGHDAEEECQEKRSTKAINQDREQADAPRTDRAFAHVGASRFPRKILHYRGLARSNQAQRALLGGASQSNSFIIQIQISLPKGSSFRQWMIERKLDPKEPFFTPLGGGGEGWGLHTTEAKWFMIESQRHSYHLVDPSPWPISGSLGALATTVGGVMYMHSFQGGATLLSLGLIFILYTMFVWWRDVLRESTLEGHHTKVVQLGLRYGFILFIVSEVMLFFAFFWAFFHSSLAPTVEIGGIWPPKGIWVLDPWEIPFLNTLILLSSGAAVTWAHHAILAGKEKRAVYALVATVLLALVFTGFQGMEYYQAPFTISDSIYGSTFYLATGFHGFHVIIGTLFLIICGIRQYLGHLTKEHHVGFEAAAWYWHFVDVVWLFLFVSIYWWGGIEEIMADYVHQEMTRNWILIYLRLFLLIVIKDVFLSLVSFLNKSKNLMDRTELILGCYERYRPLEIGASTKTKLAPKSSTERNESCLQAELPELPGFPRPVVNPA